MLYRPPTSHERWWKENGGGALLIIVIALAVAFALFMRWLIGFLG